MKNRYAMLHTYTEITTAKTIKLQYEISFPAEDSLVQKSVLHLQTSIPSMSLQPDVSSSSKLGAHKYNGSGPNLGPASFAQVPSPQSTVFSANLSLCSQSWQLESKSGRFPFVIHLRLPALLHKAVSHLHKIYVTSTYYNFV